MSTTSPDGELGLVTPLARRLWRWGGVAAVEA